MNDSLTDLVNQVYTLTNRPDLVGETILAVRNATLKAHRLDYFYKDLFETGLQFDFSLAQQTLEYKTIIPRWRALKYLRQYDYTNSTQGCAGRFLTVITPEEVLDNYSVTKENVCYVAGLELHIRSKGNFQYYILGCYVNPDVGLETYSSWVADEQPSAIIYESTATVFKTIGYDEQAAYYKQMIIEEYAMLRQSNILAIGE